MNKGKKLVFETIKNNGKRKNECDGNSRKFTTGFSRKADFWIGTFFPFLIVNTLFLEQTNKILRVIFMHWKSLNRKKNIECLCRTCKQYESVSNQEKNRERLSKYCVDI